MSLSKSKYSYSNYCLHFSKRTVPLQNEIEWKKASFCPKIVAHISGPQLNIKHKRSLAHSLIREKESKKVLVFLT